MPARTLAGSSAKPRAVQGAFQLTAALLTAALVAGGFLPATAAEDPPGEAPLRAVLVAQAEAWNRGDLETFTGYYADDALFLSPTGVTRGREEVLARYRKRYPDPAAMGRLAFEILEVRWAEGGATASVAARWFLAYPDGSREEASGLTLLVLRRRDASAWEILQDASM